MALLYKDLSYRIRGCVYTVFKTLGPGFLEGIYQKALEVELQKNQIPFESQKEINIHYDGVEIGSHKLDLVIEEKIILELKAVEEFHPSHEAQIISYLKASNLKLGFLINFGGRKANIKRFIIT